MFCCTLLYVHSSIAIILMGKRELVALLNFSSWCLTMVAGLFLAVPWGCLLFMIVVFPDHTHFTPASNLGYLAPPPPRTIFHGCQIVHWDPLDAKQRCPQKKIWFGPCVIAWFLWQPTANLRRGVCLENYSYLSCYLS